jgi:enoyl-CoA hydratase/carnithine racemase
LGLPQVEELEALLDYLKGVPTLRAIIFHSHLRFFSAGADLAFIEELSASPDGAKELARFCARMQSVFAKLEAMPMLTVAAISGICVGGGFELALACDFRIAERDATVGLPEVRIGLLPGAGGTQRLTRVAGAGVAKRVILTGALVDAGDALRLGMVQELAGDEGALEAAIQLADSVISAPRGAIAAIKHCIALAPSEAGYAAEISQTEALHREDETRSLISSFLARSRRKKVAV